MNDEGYPKFCIVCNSLLREVESNTTAAYTLFCPKCGEIVSQWKVYIVKGGRS